MTDIKTNTALCEACLHLLDIEGSNEIAWKCPICSATVRQRKADSLIKTLAYTLTALFLYIPANMLPIMIISTFAGDSPSTIIGGVVELFNNKMYFIAIVVFIASFVVPLFKILSLFYLMYSLKYDDKFSVKKKTLLFHTVEVIGKWSMLDIYVITIMTGLVNMGFLVRIVGGAGATFFAATVIFTMLASRSFDTRLIWDKQEEYN